LAREQNLVQKTKFWDHEVGVFPKKIVFLGRVSTDVPFVSLSQNLVSKTKFWDQLRFLGKGKAREQNLVFKPNSVPKKRSFLGNKRETKGKQKRNKRDVSGNTEFGQGAQKVRANTVF
jgi:hypothetical protein